MKRVALYLTLLAAAWAVPVERSDVAKLIPVETVFLYMEENDYVIETDTGDKGTGNTVDAAVQNLHDTAAGLVYLDTADYLLLEERTQEYIEEIAAYLKPSVQICKADIGVDLERASEYLSVHECVLDK